MAGRSFRPVLGFQRDQTLLAPDPETFSFHEVVHGVVGEAFGDG
jgi:hypothetical protein